MKFRALLFCALIGCPVNTAILCKSQNDATNRLKQECVNKCNLLDLQEVLRCNDQEAICVDYRLSSENLMNCLKSY